VAEPSQPCCNQALAASAALYFLKGPSVQSRLQWEALPRDTSSPENPDTHLPYKKESCSFLMRKAFYTDKVYSTQLLCILVTEP